MYVVKQFLRGKKMLDIIHDSRYLSGRSGGWHHSIGHVLVIFWFLSWVLVSLVPYYDASLPP